LAVSSASSRPSIAGDFNEWKPAPMERDGDQWSYTVAVTRGVYNYAFVGADGSWFVPKDVPGRKDDGMGGYVAVLVVR
jgi:1,4-alpha-glucan branching enzyme